MAADMLTNHLVRDLDDHDLSVLHTRNTQNGLVGVACVNPLHKKISRPAPHFTCATNNPDYISLWHSKPAPDDRWASSKALQLARVRYNCLPQQHAQL